MLSSATSADGRTVVCEMKNRLNVMGHSLNDSYETAIATFDAEGLIKEFKVYCCRSHLMVVVQAVTGLGPYDKEHGREEWE